MRAVFQYGATLAMPVTRDDVVNSYRTFLGRNPESEDVVSAHMRASGLDALHRGFLQSPEFRQKYTMPAAPVRIDLPRNEVEVEVDSEALNVLLAHVRRCWEFMGQERPHHSVLTSPNFLPDALKHNEADFWESGEHDANILVVILSRYGVTSLSKLSCIDFGCGVGRVTAPLAKRFAKVNAYDISAPHMEIAKSRTLGADFHLLRELPVIFVQTDVFYSRIVLQHNPPPIIALLIRSALNCLNPGGIAVFQVPTYEIGYSFAVRRYLKGVAKAASDMEMHCLPQHHIFRIAKEVGCDVLEVREEGSTGRFGSDISNLFVIQR
jgi:SAM-dependent methyltransferase